MIPIPMADMPHAAPAIYMQEVGKMTQALASRPLLATNEQIEAERALLQLIDDPDIKALQQELRAELAATLAGGSDDAAARLDQAVIMWTNSLIMLETATDQPEPAFIWATDDTPHEWMGHLFPGSGIAGDNPDGVYRIVTLDGNGRYVIEGRIDMAHRPAETTFDVTRGDLIPQAPLKNQSNNHADMGLQVSFTDDRKFTVAPDGRFRLEVGREGSGPDHLATADGTTTVLIREMLSDWNQRPADVRIRRIDRPATPGASAVRPLAALKAGVLQKLPAYIRFWGKYKDIYMGGLAPNVLGGPAARDGGWGYIAAVRFKLQPDQAILLTTTSQRAGYTGAQLSDPWMITPDARANQISLNSAQARANADGSFTYIVSPRDPGVANWIDTTGLHEGFVLLRWQVVPQAAEKDALVRDCRVVNLSDLPAMPGVPRTAPQERGKIVGDRPQSHARRLQ